MHEFLLTAVQQPSMSGLLEMLRLVTERTSSFGCILWQEVPRDGDAPAEALFVLADWFPSEIHCANHELGFANSRTGRAIREDRQIVADIAEIPDPDLFLIETKIQTICTTPIRFQDGSRGAMNIYRNTPEPYTDQTRAVAKQLAALVPLLYEIIRDRVSATLLTRITEITRAFDAHAGEGVKPLDHARDALEKICRSVAAAFNCFEVSIYLEDAAAAPERYVLASTTHPALAQRKEYLAGDDHGITGWTLAHKDAQVRIFDLADPARSRGYPGMQWQDSGNIRAVVRDHLRVDESRLPPLSWMGAPILRGSHVAGVIRCSVSFGPWYFAPSEYSILRMVASHLGSFWGAILDRRDVDSENASLKQFVEKMVSLNEVAQAEITKTNPDENAILSAALRITSSVIPDAVINDVRLVTEDGKGLRFAVTEGADWSKGTPEEISTRKNRPYPLEGDKPASAGAYVVQTGEVAVMDDVTKNPYYVKNFPRARRMIIAPIQLRDSAGNREVYGVLDVRGTGNVAFPRFAEDIALLLGSQLALYKKLGAMVRDLNRALTELKNLNEVHIRLNEDIAHQLMSPLGIALKHVQQSFRKVQHDEAMTDVLQTLRGAILRAINVCSSLDMFVKLERDGEIPVKPGEMTGSELISMLINTGIDASRLREGFLPIGPVKSVWDGSLRRRTTRGRYHVTTEGFDRIDKIKTDPRLLEQALTQILDNAFKYSAAGSLVEVKGGYTGATRRDLAEKQRVARQSLPASAEASQSDEKRKRIRIAVVNEGVYLSDDDSRRVTERGYQAEDATKYKQGGSGIGLWIVKEIVNALEGDLEIHPTDSEGKTEIAMILPVE